MSILIKNGKIFTKGILINKNIFIEKGKIAKITNQLLKADQVINATNKIILPGLIDSHVHFREPGHIWKEDFFTGSKAAAAGGITTILDMPNNKTPTITEARLLEKRRLARKSLVNFGFHFGTTQDNIKEINKVKNIASIKIYMDETTGDLIIEDDKALQEIFNLPITKSIHAEKEKILKALELSEKNSSKLYFCHVSSKEELDYILNNKKSNMFIEVTPHHLFLSEDEVEKHKGFADVKPPLKPKDDQIALWEAIKSNKIDTIATDHAPHTYDEKMKIEHPVGLPGCQTMLPLLLNAVNENLLTLKKLVQLCCENPAKIFKIKGKGFIEQGNDADLVIIDMELEKEVINEQMFTKVKWSPYNGMMLKGWPITTIVNGNIVFENNKFNDIKAREVVFNG